MLSARIAAALRGIGRAGSAPPAEGVTSTPATSAARAVAAYEAMQKRFVMHGGSPLYRESASLLGRGQYAHLWPFSRALAATLDLSGLPPALTGHLDLNGAIEDRLAALERYWAGAAYSSDVVEPSGRPGDLYNDDNAWIGLALVQDVRMHGRAASRVRAEAVYRFLLSGWDHDPDHPHPGGVFWLEQGTGSGARNHDRNTVSTAGSAQLGLHLRELSGSEGDGDSRGGIGPGDMCRWVNETLADERGLYWDKVRGNGRIDETEWSYNQGLMVGANVLQHRLERREASVYLTRAETIARAALAHYSRLGYFTQPPAFNAIFFHNLLSLHAVTSDDRLADAILAAMRAYADEVWDTHRGRANVFELSRGAPKLIDQAAMVQIYALLGLDAAAYAQLA